MPGMQQMMGITFSFLLSATLTTGVPEQSVDYGFLNQPAYSTDKAIRPPLTPYDPQPGDVVLFSNANFVWKMFYAMAFTGAPGHSGMVVRMEDGRPGVIEAGYGDSIWIRLTPLDQRLCEFKGTTWIRRRKTPVTAEQSRVLTEFAEIIDGRRYSVTRLLIQLTPLSARGPIKTKFLGKPNGIRNSYICSEAVLEGLVLAGLVDAETTRPAATFPRDLFFDSSPNRYIDRHPPLVHGWERPALWLRCQPY
jgi:hypothetical protein